MMDNQDIKVVNNSKIGELTNKSRNLSTLTVLLPVTAGTLEFGGTEVRQGGSFFLPFAVKSLQITGKGNCILIRPPRAR